MTVHPIRLATLSIFTLALTVGFVPQAIAPWSLRPATAQDVDEETNIRVYEKASPAVVAIETDSSTGSGSIVTPDGLVLTNAHVLAEAGTTVKVTLADGREVNGEVVAFDAGGLDLAAVQIRGETDLPTIPIAAPNSVRVGQRAFAIGSPFGFRNTFTTGIVSRIDDERGVIQTDAAINPGNSGGPLLNSQGELIGVNTAIFSPSANAGNIGIGFAIGVEEVEPFLAAVRDGTAPRTAQRQAGLGGFQAPQTIALDDPPLVAALERGDNVLAMDNSLFDAYTFEGKAGQQVEIEMSSQEIDPYLILLSPSGAEVAQDDDSGGDKNARLVVQLPESGTYTLIANSYAGGESGAYRLSVKTAMGETIPAERTRTTILRENGELQAGDATLSDDGSLFDAYSFEGQEGQTVTIILESPDFDTYLILVGADGSPLARNDDASNGNTNSLIRLRLPYTGTYGIIVNSYDSTGSGRYTLVVE
ncbi:MAG TPA: trypsin-like peptidase domain-containing protein [Oscillatoriales cyanobacterium M59_W2019_021]|nr:trypsin-like peptidase domain-containing protein [Oscillatoriales cyanobacterium M59_W2019_021]